MNLNLFHESLQKYRKFFRSATFGENRISINHIRDDVEKGTTIG